MYCQNCNSSTLFDDPIDGNRLKCLSAYDAGRFRDQYLRSKDTESLSLSPTAFSQRENLLSPTITSLFSPSSYSLPTETVSRVVSPSDMGLSCQNSILVRAYSKQVHPL